MANTISKPRGTNDFYGLEKKKLDDVTAKLDHIALRYGCEPFEVPTFEESRLFKRGVGESTDIVNKETFDLVNKGGHDYTLRPEFTAGINRAVIENKLYASPDLPLKYSYCGSIFRYERPQVGRFREFHQWGVEFLDRQVDLLTTVSCLSLFFNQVREVLKIEPILKLNFLGSFDSREAYKTALKDFFTPRVGSMCSDCQRRLEQNPLRILDCKVDADRAVIESAPVVTDFLTSNDLAEYAEILTALTDLQIPYVQDEKLVRGLDYYTGLVFEVYDREHMELGALGGGGKYGHLMRDLGGPDFEGIGYSFGVERLVLALGEREVEPYSLDLFIIALRPKGLKDVLQLSDTLRQQGYKVSSASFSKALNGALKMADRKNARLALIVDERGYHLKDMKTRAQKDSDDLAELHIEAALKEK